MRLPHCWCYMTFHFTSHIIPAITATTLFTTHPFIPSILLLLSIRFISLSSAGYTTHYYVARVWRCGDGSGSSWAKQDKVHTPNNSDNDYYTTIMISSSCSVPPLLYSQLVKREIKVKLKSKALPANVPIIMGQLERENSSRLFCHGLFIIIYQPAFSSHYLFHLAIMKMRMSSF